MRWIATPKKPIRRLQGRMATRRNKAVAADIRLRKFIRKQLIEENGAVCAICGRPFRSMKEITIDHIAPRSKGGANAKENCQLACRKCNQEKGDSLPA